MQLIEGVPVYSATDLVGFLACEHLTNLERAAAAGMVERPMRVDPELDRIAKRGLQHERRFLESLRADGFSIEEIEQDEGIDDRGERLRDQAARTLEAMRRGVDVIYQATFLQSDGEAERVSPADGTSTPGLHWLGFADFLRRVEVPSDLGSWSYEAWDTKLARHTKASAVLQLCLYSSLLATLQGRTPAEMHVALGGSRRAVDDLRTADYLAYFRLVRSRFETFVGQGAPATYPPPTRPDPVEHCEVCRWSLVCSAWWREHDDLSLVAGITTAQRRALRELEPPVLTRRALAAAPLRLPRLERTSAESLTRVREQARIQVEGEDAGHVLYELLDPSRLRDGSLEPDRGLLSLPEPSPGDLFFDIEGDPFAFDDGIDYLFGVIEPGPPAGARTTVWTRTAVADTAPPPAAGLPAFHAIWSVEADGQVGPAAERRAFEQLVDLIIDRRRRDPDMHVYHYAAYEPTAMGRLSERHATREDEVDDLLRNGVFVDLFRAVRQGLRASVESYSIKKLEPLYGLTREVDLRDAGSSIVAFETWLELGEDEAAQGPQILARIAGYNRDDCVSNWRLRDWLEERRVELAARLEMAPAGLPRPSTTPIAPPENLSDYLARVHDLEAHLTADLTPAQLADPRERTAEQHARWLMAQLLQWHRREDKSAWWRYFHLLDLTDEERIEEADALGGLVHVGEVGQLKRSTVHRYRFPPQEHEIEPGTPVVDPATRQVDAATGQPTGSPESPGEVVAVDNAAGTIDLKRGPSKARLPHPTSLVPKDLVEAREQRASLLRVGASIAEQGIDAEGLYRAARDVLLRRPPRLRGSDPAAGPSHPSDSRGEPARVPLHLAGEQGTDALRRLAPLLDHSCLAVQGPPGSGKTTAGAELIVDLVVEHGCRVGVTANSHKVIGNLLDKVAEKATERGTTVRIGQKPAVGEVPTCRRARSLDSNAGLRDAIAGDEIDVAGATAWAWSREDLAGSLDVLVVDEAGQVSLANLIAVAPAADSVVLLGDPQQLDQPRRGSHPPGAEQSALGHLLGGARTMPDDLGILLESTWRLHPDICGYTSEVFYEGRLQPGDGAARQDLVGPGILVGTGIRWVPVEHSGDRNSSADEAALISDLLDQVREAGGTWIDADGRTRELGLGGALVITPYNAQVREIASRLADVRVGTVDKFQGQEAPISIYSMATSSAAEAPRGMEFLYSLNRLNVATSRARCLTLVVASPDLIRVQCRTPRQMRLANALARLVEVGEEKVVLG